MNDQTPSDQAAAIDPIDKEVSWDETYELVIYNDSISPLELVVELLMSHFLILQNDATIIALRVHADGQASIGRLAHESAQNVKHNMVKQINRRGVPLRVEVSRWSASRTTTE